MRKISLACADAPFKSYLNLLKCLQKKRLGRGEFVSLFEQRAADYFGVKHALAVSNGTLADIVMLAALKELYPGKNEVILPALTFVAHSNAVLWAGLKPVFVDVDENFQMKPQEAAAAINENTLCVFPAHLIGIYSPAAALGKTYPDIPVLEDVCEAMGGSFHKRKFGTFGIAGSFSMYPSHTITTGEGGIIISNDTRFMDVARSIHNHGKRKTDFDFDFVGINAKMTNLQAAIGCELVDQIDKVNDKRRFNVRLYNTFLGANFRAEAPHCYPYLYESESRRNRALSILEEAGVEARKLMGCIPDYDFYKMRGFSGKPPFTNARRAANCGLFLPVHQELSEKDIEYVCSVLPRW